MGQHRATLIPATPSERFARVFAWYTRRLISRSFAGVLLVQGSRAPLERVNEHSGAVILVLNHSSWWDPLVAFTLARTLLPARSGIAPMDAQQIRRFGFFRKLGMFGIDPDDPVGLSSMVSYAADFCNRQPHPMLMCTPQGRFADVREPVRIRPGAAACAARIQADAGKPTLCASLAIEYTFWQDRRATVLLRAEPVIPPSTCTTTAWHRAIESTMQANADALSRLVIARDPAAFESLLDRSGPAVNPAYDLLLRLRGRSGDITARRLRTVTADADGGGV